MVERTTFRPHAISCIKDSVANLLKEHCKDNLTVSCDRDDCWSDSELFKWRQAINIVSGNDNIGAPVRRPREGRKLNEVRTQAESQCYHEAILNIDVQIYVEQCDDPDACMDAKSKAYAILAHVTGCLTSFQDQLLGRRILYQGSNYQRDSDGELDVVVVTGNFQIHYLFDQTRPWVANN